MPSALNCLRPFRSLESETDSRGHVGLQVCTFYSIPLFSVFSVFNGTPSRLKMQTIQYRKPGRIWELKEDKYTKRLAKTQVCADMLSSCTDLQQLFNKIGWSMLHLCQSLIAAVMASFGEGYNNTVTHRTDPTYSCNQFWKPSWFQKVDVKVKMTFLILLPTSLNFGVNYYTYLWNWRHRPNRPMYEGNLGQSWILDSTLRIPDSWSMVLGFWIQFISGIAEYLCCIPDSINREWGNLILSWFHKQNFPGFSPLHGAIQMNRDFFETAYSRVWMGS